MDSRGNIYPMNDESISLVDAMGDVLKEIPQEDLNAVFSMNRQQRRELYRKLTRRRGKGWTK